VPHRETIENNLKGSRRLDMTRMNRWVLMAGIASAMCLGANYGLAQQDNQNQGRPGRGNFDPAQFRERMMERVKEQLEVTDDSEWKALQPLVEKVMDARMAAGGGGGRGMMGMRRGGGGGDNPPADGGARRFGPPPSPEAEALQKAIDAKAPKAELKAAMAKYVESRKTKQAELEKAQEELRKVLSTRQEAIATVNGWL
jgi:hypothetical protein